MLTRHTGSNFQHNRFAARKSGRYKTFGMFLDTKMSFMSSKTQKWYIKEAIMQQLLSNLLLKRNAEFWKDKK